MKRQLLTLAIAVSVAATAQAQLTLRPYAGINSHTLTEDFEDAKWQSSLGYQLGADLQIGKKFYVQPGVQLEFATCGIVPKIEDVKVDFKRTHLRVPIMVGYAFGSISGVFAGRAYTGPNASFVLSSKSEEGIFDIKKGDLNNALYGWNVGAGFDFSIVFVDFGYQFGLSKVFKNIDNGSIDNYFYANGGVRIRF